MLDINATMEKTWVQWVRIGIKEEVRDDVRIIAGVNIAFIDLSTLELEDYQHQKGIAYQLLEKEARNCPKVYHPIHHILIPENFSLLLKLN